MLESPSASDLPVIDPETGGKARRLLAKRLTDIVCLPTSRITPQERHLTADLLIEMLREGAPDLRGDCAKRIAMLAEAPSIIIRLLARDAISVARPILEESEALTDSDLVATARAGTREHREIIAARRPVSELVADAVAIEREPSVQEILLRNPKAELSLSTVEQIVVDSRDNPHFCELLVRRPELRPGHGFAIFWWSPSDVRLRLIRRFATERSILQEAAADVFAIAADDAWADPLVRKALQFIERRQRNRGAIQKSPFGSLEEAVDAVERDGLSRQTAEEIAYLAGVKPAAGAQILMDQSGEPLAVLCKAAGLKQRYLDILWKALRRPFGTPDEPAPAYARTVEMYETMSTDKAQSVLRYWNWALTSAFSPTTAQSLDGPMPDPHDELTTPEMTARLVFGRR